MSKHGTMATDRPERYAKQLASHWSEKATVSEDDGTTMLVMGNGNTAALHPADGVLQLEVSVPEGGDLDRWAQVVADHLQRFGQRDELQVVWS